MGEQLRLLLSGHVFAPRHLSVEIRLDLLFEVAARGVVDLAGQYERHLQTLGDLDREVLPLVRIDPCQLDEVVLFLIRFGDGRVLAGVDRVVHHPTPLHAGDRGLLRATDGDKMDLPVDGVEEVAFGFSERTVQRRHDRRLQPRMRGHQHPGQARVVVDDVERPPAYRLVRAMEEQVFACQLVVGAELLGPALRRQRQRFKRPM